MTLQLQHILNYGTSTAAVARTMIQGQPIIQPLQVTEERRQDALNVLGDLMKTLLRGVEIHEQIAGAVGVAHAQLEAGTLVLRPQPYTLRPPSIPDLDNKAESFAQAAKLAIAHATRLTVPFYDQDFGHNKTVEIQWKAPCATLLLPGIAESQRSAAFSHCSGAPSSCGMKTLLADVIGVSRSDRPRSASCGATLFRCKCANARTILGQAAMIVRIRVNYEEFPARFREAGSFIAGILIGVSIVVLVFASIGANMSDWQTLLVFGAPIILILGVTLQVVTTAKPRHERIIITDRRPSSGFEDVIPRNRAFSGARDREVWPMLQQSLTREVLYR